MPSLAGYIAFTRSPHFLTQRSGFVRPWQRRLSTRKLACRPLAPQFWLRPPGGYVR